MCQGCVPEYFEFKQSPAPLPQNWLNSRFLTQATEEKDKDKGTDSFEYRVASDAPCPIIDAHVHGKNLYPLPPFFYIIIIIICSRIFVDWEEETLGCPKKKAVCLKT